MQEEITRKGKMINKQIIMGGFKYGYN